MYRMVQIMAMLLYFCHMLEQITSSTDDKITKCCEQK